MPSQTTSPPLTVTMLAALWVSLGRCHLSESPGPRCDNGKLYLDRDLPEDAVYWDCLVSAWPASAQRRPSIDTMYDPEPARQICMDKSISYNHTIPSSGAYRPTRAESGEYLYCPPQRWLNNLHHGATVLLYHPCAPLHERLLLSVLARSCLPGYIITPHPQLNKHTPIALVSWGRTLEVSTIASSDVCDWLETTTSTRNKSGVVSPSRIYDLLLTWSAEQHWQQHAHTEEHSVKTKESLRRCCEQTISSLLNGAMQAVSNMKKKEKGKSRQIRAAIRGKHEVKDENKTDNTVTHVSSFSSNQTTISRTQDIRRYNSTLGPSADPLSGNRSFSDPPAPREAPSQSKIQSITQGLTPGPTTPLGSDMLNTHSVSSGAPESQKSRLTLQTAAQKPSSKHTALTNPNPSAGLDVLADGANSELNHSARSEALGLSEGRSKGEGTDSVKPSMKENDFKERHSDKDNTADGTMKDNEVVDVKERELEHKQRHSDTHSHHKSEKTGFDSVSKSQSKSPSHLEQHPNPQPETYLPTSHNCDGCEVGQSCECNKDSGADVRASVVNKGLPRTPRTDEAVWAAAALGFLLVLLTLSVLHTRLYRYWRTTPSLYWHDPQQDYDSVADVIRRRLRIAKRRRKRGRRQECVLLPSSSSSDEYP